MAFVLTLLYTAYTLLSPAAFPDGLETLHISLIVAILILITSFVNIQESKIFSIPDTYLALGLLGAVTFSTIATGWFGGAIGTFVNFVPSYCIFFFIVLTCNNLLRVKILVYVLILVAFFVTSQGAIAYQAGDQSSKYLFTEYANTNPLFRIRGLGVLADPNDFAQIIVTLIPLLWLRWKKDHFLPNFLFTILPASVLLVALYLTHSRGGIVALLAVFLFGFKDKLSIVGSTILSGIALVGAIVLNASGGRALNEDDGSRVTLWAQGLETLKIHPIFGIGFGNFADITGGKVAHNSYVSGMVELGLVGYFCWMAMIVSSLSGLSRLIPSQPKAVTGSLEAQNSRTNRSLPLAMPHLANSAVGASDLSVGPIAMQSSYAPARPANWAAYATSMPNGNAGSDSSDAAQLAYAAKIVRISFVGMLTAAFFISRTYSEILYVMFGIAACVIKMSPTRTFLDFSFLAKRTLLVVVLSVVGIYLLVRLHGGK